MLYVVSFQVTAIEFIGVWLALKVAGQWRQWNEGQTLDNDIKITGREIFNTFLIGNALSIIYAIVGAKIIEWYIKPS